MTLQGDPGDVNRPSRSRLRQEHARVTRAAILDAAHELFLTDGYAATTIKRVAHAAGVSEQTVYNTFDDKPTLLYEVGKQVVSGDLGAERRHLVAQLQTEEDPLQRIAVIAAETRRTYEQGMLRFESMLLDAAASDARVAEIAAGAWRQKYEDIERLFPLILPDEVRNDDFDLNEAIDLVFAMENASSMRILIEDRGWSWDQYERLYATTLRRLFTRIQD